MPTGTPFPGPWSNWRTPYAIEVMDSLSPFNQVQIVDMMSGAQVVKSASAECVVGYYMDASPTGIVYVSGTDSLLEKWASKRLEPLIESIGMRDKLMSMNESKGARATGDKSSQKLFTGGFLELVSAQSSSALRSETARLLILEECDAAPPELSTGEGFWDQVVEARTKAFGLRRKIYAVSTPTTFRSSVIYRRFLLGDQREYFIPCPRCGKEILLTRGSETGSHGLRAEYEAGILKLVWYQCDACQGEIFENEKNKFMPGGRWIPQAVCDPIRRSYHINSLYSPLGMYSWMDYWRSYQEAIASPEGMRSFTNLQDGMPYRETGHRPKLENIIELRGGYMSGTIPDGVLYLVASADVQRGSEKDEKNPPRIEIEVLGIGEKHRTWSIQYFRIEGDISDPFDGAWQELHEMVMSGAFSFKRKDGMPFDIKLFLIDSGDGVHMQAVYRFCERLENTKPCKGFQKFGRRTKTRKEKEKESDEITQGNVQRYRLVTQKTGVVLYEVATNYYKNIIYDNLGIQATDEGEEEKAAFCSFPIDYPETYFQMLRAEDKLTDGSFVDRGRRNEALDIRVYGLCAADIWLYARVMYQKVEYKKAGANELQLQQINHRFIIEQLKKITAPIVLE